jgi:hypothetical protein
MCKVVKSNVSYLGEDQASYGVNNTYLLKAKLSGKADKHFMKLAEFSKQIAESARVYAKAWNVMLGVRVFLKK